MESTLLTASFERNRSLALDRRQGWVEEECFLHTLGMASYRPCPQSQSSVLRWLEFCTQNMPHAQKPAPS